MAEDPTWDPPEPVQIGVTETQSHAMTRNHKHTHRHTHQHTHQHTHTLHSHTNTHTNRHTDRHTRTHTHTHTDTHTHIYPWTHLGKAYVYLKALSQLVEIDRSFSLVVR